MTDAQQPASWYADPTGRHQYRYWNGTEWTDQVADNQVTSTDPPTMPSGAAPAAGPAPAAPVPGPAAGPAPAATPKAPKVPGKPLWAWIAAFGGVALIIGSFLNALNASILGASVDKNYFDGDGPLTLVVGIVIVLLAVLVARAVLSRAAGWFIFALGIVGALVAIADIFDVKDKLDQLKDLGGTGSIGPALWVCLAGGVIALVGGLLTYATASTNPPAPGPQPASPPPPG